jgi:hypothetical protein
MDSGFYEATIVAQPKNLTITGLGNVTKILEYGGTGYITISIIPPPYQISIVGLTFLRSYPAPEASIFLMRFFKSSIVMQNCTIDVALGGMGVKGTDGNFVAQDLILRAGASLAGSRGRLDFDGSDALVSISNFQVIDATGGDIVKNPSGTTVIRSSYFFNLTSSVVFNDNGTILVDRVTMEEGSGIPVRCGDGLGIYGASTISIVSSHFRRVRFASGAFLSGIAMRKVDLIDSEFTDIRSSGGYIFGPFLNNEGGGNYTILRSNFTDIRLLKSPDSLTRGGVISLGFPDSVRIESSRFERCGAPRIHGGVLAVWFLDVTVNVTILIKDSVFRSNEGYAGGAILVQRPTQLIVEGCLFENNSATEAGGAIKGQGWNAPSTSVRVSSSVFRNNFAVASEIFIPGPYQSKLINGAGGAISFDGPLASFNATNCVFENNSATHLTAWGDGGAVALTGYFPIDRINISNCDFIGNTVYGVEPSTGGALSITGIFQASVSGCRFSFNRAQLLRNAVMFYEPGRRLAFGGAIFSAGSPLDVSSSSLQISSCEFYNNEAAQGGAMVLQQVSSVLSDIRVSGNSATATTAGLLLISNKLLQRHERQQVQISQATFSNNSLSSFGDFIRVADCQSRGVQSQPSFVVACDQCTFSNDSSPSLPTGAGRLPYGPHIGSIGGPLFLLRSPAARHPSKYVHPCETTVLGGCVEVGLLLRDCRITSDFSAIELVWASPPVAGPTAQLPSCEGFLTNTTLNQTGWNAFESTCRMEGNIVTIQSTSLPFPGFVQLISTAFTPRFFASGPHIINAPFVKALSAASLSAPSILDNCADTFISGADSKIPGVFSKVFSWNVVEYPVGDTAIRDFILSQQNRSAFALPYNLWSISAQNRTLTISLSVRSVLGPFSDPVYVTMTRFADPRPDIFLEGPLARKQFAMIETTLNARVSIPSCLSLRGISVTREWKLRTGTVTPSLVDLFQVPWIGQSLYLPSGSLVAGGNYQFEFSARVDQLSELNTTITVSLEALYSPITLYSSGDGGWVSKNRSLDLQVTIIDPDNTASFPSYVWDIGCVNESAGNLTQPIPLPYYIPAYENGRHLCRPECPQFSFGITANNSIAAGALIQRAYTVFLDVSKDSRSLSATYRVNVTGLDPLKIRLTPRWNGPKPSRAERIAVSASVNGFGLLNTLVYFAEWKVLLRNMSEVSGLVNPAFVSTPLDGSALVIAFRPYAFQESSNYVLQLTIYNANRTEILGRNWIDLEINEPPKGGSVSLSSASIDQFETVQITSLDWTDDDAPLRFTVSIALSGNADDEYLLADSVETQSLELSIPFAGNHVLRTRIIDSLGGETVVDSPLTIRSTTADSTTLLQDFRNLLRVGDLRRATGLFGFLANSPNETLRPILASSIRDFASQSRITSINAQLMLGILLKINVTREDALEMRVLAADLVTTIVDAVFNSSSFGSSASRLLSAQSVEGLRSLRTLVTALSSTIRSISDAVGGGLDAARRLKLVSTSLKLVQIMSRVSLLNEELTSSNSTLAAFEALSLVRCGDVPVNLDIRGNAIRAVPIGANSCTLGAGVAFSSSYWSNGTFPIPIYQNRTYGNSTTLVIIPIPILSVVINPREAVVFGWNVSVTFFDFPVPPTPPSAQQAPRCVQMDTESHRWTSAGCDLSVENSRYVCTCTPRAIPTTGSSGVLVSVVFGDFSNEQDIQTLKPAPQMLTPTGEAIVAPADGSSPSQGGSNQDTSSPVAVAAIVATVVVVVVAVGVVIGGLMIWKRRERKASENLKKALSTQK